MTGSTAVHMSRPVDVQYSGSGMNDDSSEEQPFDQMPSQKQQQQRSSSNSNMRSEEYLDDGELPSLTRRNKVAGSSNNNTMPGGRVINGQRTTTRPLSPPNPAGLKVGREQREFWGQLDKGEDEDGETWNEEEDYRRDEEADMPEDELRGTRSSNKRRSGGGKADQIHRRTGGKNSRQAAARTITDVDEEGSSIGRKDTYDSSEYYDEELEEETYLDNNYCDQTLSALMDMCGKGLSVVKTQSNENTTSIRSGKDTPREGESPEEHTAIEVEFVEPPKGNLSPQRKNAYLTALARKAKIDFNKKKELSASTNKGAEVNSLSPQDVAELYTQDEDVYHSFSASEKRKFLKLINTGVPPAQAQHQVLQDRSNPSKKRKSSKKMGLPIEEEGEDDEEKVEESEMSYERTSEESKSPNSKNAKLAFWKKTRSRRLAARGLINPNGEAADSTYPESESDDSAKFAKSGINYYDGIRREVSDEESEEDISGVAASPSQNRSKRRPKSAAGVSFAALRDRRAQSAPRPRTLDDSLLKEDESSIDGVPPQVTPSPERKSSGAASGSGVAFRALKERRSKSTPRGRYGELPLPPLGPGKASPIREEVGSEDMYDDKEDNPKAPGTPSARTVEDLLPQGATKVAKEMDHTAELEKIEQELLKAPLPTKRAMSTPPPSPPAPPGSGSATKSTKELSSVNPVPSTKPSSSPVNEMFQTPAIGKKKREVSVQVDGLDVSIDTYMNSTDMYSTNKSAASIQSHQNPNDSVSVYTMGTGATGVTSGTTHTQSSRVYRRGTAKGRLAKAKEVEDVNKGKGWHETIRKAAASTNRKWEPKAGWVDYEEPKIELPAEKSKEKMHIDLNKPWTSHKEVKEEQNSEKGTSTPVPFPKDWEKERSKMIENTVDLGRELDFHHEEKKLETPVPSMQDGQYASEPQDPNKPRGWLETMKAASASLAPEGHTWDPQHGWTKVDEKKDSVEDTVDFGVPSHVRSLDLPDNGGQEGSQDSQVLQISQSAPVPERSEMLMPAPNSASKDSDKKLNQWIAKVEQGPKKLSERSAESSDRAVASAGTERYIQLGDNGSIRSHTHSAPRPTNKEITSKNSRTAESSYISDDETEVDSAPLLIASGAFPSLDDRPLSPIVGIVTEKVGAEEMGLFPVEPPKPKRVSGGVSRVVQENQHTEDTSLADTSARSSRRGAGPVDTDEVDETWDSDDEQRCSNRWETDSKSAGLELSYTRSKPIPKLSRSKRDTSPLSKRTPSTSENAGLALPVQTNMEDSKDAAEQDNKVITGSSSVRARRQQWENRTEKTESILHDLSASEGRLQDSPPRNKNSPGTAEWKSFLGKKVRAESAAAAGRRVTEGEEKIKKEPEGGKLEFQRKLEKFEHPSRDVKYQEDDDDSLFEFSEKRVHNKSTAGETSTFQSDLSPIRRRGEEVEREPSEAYGPEEGDRGNFFKRLAECAAPVMPTVQGSFVPPNLCSRADLHEEEEEASSFLEDVHLNESLKKGSDVKTRSKSAPRPRPRAVETTSSSVVSEDFGAKTAYLEAIAMRAAVSKPRSSSRKRSSGSSVVSSTSSAHSEKWKAFLERKRASGKVGSSAKASSTSSVSKAAEKYAAEKVEEMMLKMSSRGNKERQIDDMLNKSKDSTKERKKVESVRAAEDLAAARVEAMMAALSNNNVDEGEI